MTEPRFTLIYEHDKSTSTVTFETITLTETLQQVNSFLTGIYPSMEGYELTITPWMAELNDR